MNFLLILDYFDHILFFFLIYKFLVKKFIVNINEEHIRFIKEQEENSLLEKNLKNEIKLLSLELENYKSLKDRYEEDFIKWQKYIDVRNKNLLEKKEKIILNKKNNINLMNKKKIDLEKKDFLINSLLENLKEKFSKIDNNILIEALIEKNKDSSNIIDGI